LEAPSGTVFASTTETARRHGRDLIPKLADTLREAGVRLGDVEVLAVGLGPGSYTGLRVGLTAAKTLAYATGVPLIGIDSLKAVALNAPIETLTMSVIADAQRGEVYVAEYAREAAGGPLLCIRASQIEPLSGWLSRMDPAKLVLGPALNSPRIQAVLPSWLRQADPALNYPEGRSLVGLARENWAKGQRDDLWLLEPHYLRRSAAEEKRSADSRPQSD
jgi:tRNA threonylcarbamoyladenosine biosynthesis protein TsaB